MNVFVVKRLVNTVNHSVPQAAIADMMFTRAGSRMSQVTSPRLTGVSEGWFQALESGAPREFSDAFLLRVAQTLRLSDTETLTLFLDVSGRRPPMSGAQQAGATVDPVTVTLLEHQAPYPA
ncbi:helix-turn-helix domain-containing protein [Streptomyces netropsis]|uniref:helix-turn-helix domain-containing protein n=1 Tax=Streptomyces netropsis TaxID=55404 RepID=UPI0037975026